jgi:hypothetical protein
MRIKSSWLRNQIVGCLVMLLAVPFADAAATPIPQQSANGQPRQAATAPQHKPDTPDAISDEAETVTDPAKPAYPDSPTPVPPQTLAQSTQSGSNQQQNPPANPVGTAAAPYEKPTGVAASRPAGAVIAPAKQKRARIILIRVAVVVGAAAAVGAVVALSKGSPSRPN